MEFLEGVSLTDLAAVQRVTDVRPDEVLINALNTWFLSLTMCPTFHADVHAGKLNLSATAKKGHYNFQCQKKYILYMYTVRMALISWNLAFLSHLQHLQTPSAPATL